MNAMDNAQTLRKVFDGHEIRIIRHAGEVWLVANDVTDALGIANGRHACTRLDDDEKNTVVINDGNRGNPNSTVINEAGCYRLIFTSRKPEAERFKRWLAHDVLPALRKTGTYSMHDRQPPGGPTTLDALEGIVSHLREQDRRVAELERRADEAETRRIRAEQDLKSLPEAEVDAPEVSDRKRLVRLVKEYSAATGTFHQIAWRQLYQRIYDAMGVDVRARARNRGTSKIQVLDDDGLLKEAYAVGKRTFGHALK